MQRRPRRGLVASLVLLLGALVSACTATRSYTAEGYAVPIDRPASILLLEPDVEVSLLTTGGLLQPDVDWTEQARANLVAAVESFQASRGFTVRRIDTMALPLSEAALFTGYERLHAAVGSAIAQHHYGGTTLPTKRGRFDWTLGPGAAALGRVGGGSYSHALFLVARDSFASTGRVVLNVVAAALFGGIPGGGQRFAYASLVDLRSGAIVWFNVLQSSTGDMRDPEGARSTINTLFRSMPGAVSASGGTKTLAPAPPEPRR